MTDATINAGKAPVEEPKSRGEVIYDEMNSRIKGTFEKLMELTQPAKGATLDVNVRGLMAEINSHLRDAMYRVNDIVTLIDRQDKHGDRVDVRG